MAAEIACCATLAADSGRRDDPRTRWQLVPTARIAFGLVGPSGISVGGNGDCPDRAEPVNAARSAPAGRGLDGIRLVGMLLVEKHEDRLTDEKAYLTFDDAPAEQAAGKVVSMAAGQ